MAVTVYYNLTAPLTAPVAVAEINQMAAAMRAFIAVRFLPGV
jgi:hypothetical protein